MDELDELAKALEQVGLDTNCNESNVDEVEKITVPETVEEYLQELSKYYSYCNDGYFESYELHRACLQNNLEELKRKLNSRHIDVIIMQPNNFNDTVIEIAERFKLHRVMKMVINFLKCFKWFSSVIETRRLNTFKLLLKNMDHQDRIKSFTDPECSVLLAAVSYGWFDGCQFMLKYSSNVNLEYYNYLDYLGSNSYSYDYDPRFLLHIACKKKYYDIVKLLIENKADVNIRGSKYQPSLLLVACDKNDLELVELLLTNNIDMEAKGPINETPLGIAIKHKNFDILKMLVQRGFNVNQESGGKLPLLTAVQGELIDIARFLIKNNADINSKDSSSIPIFHYVIQTHNQELINLFLDNNVDVEGTCGKNVTPLFFAVTEKNVDLVQTLINRGAKVNVKCKGITPLCQAVVTKNINIIKLLLENQADINCTNDSKDTEGYSPLHLAVMIENMDIVKVLMEKGANKNSLTRKTGMTPLMCALSRKHKDLINYFLQQGVKVKIQDRYQTTAIHIAAQSGYADLVKELIERKANVNVKNHQQLTPLHLAAQIGYVDVIEVLLNNNAEIDSVAKHGDTPLFHAIKHRKTEAAALLINRGADPNGTYKLCCNPLLHAITQRLPEVAILLLEKNASVSLEDGLSGYILYYAVHENYKDIIKLLIERGIKVNIRNEESKATALQAACHNNNLQIAQMLIDAGADVNCEPIDSYGTPLYEACSAANKELVRIIIEAGADVNKVSKGLICSSKGCSPLEAAFRKADEDIVNLLLDHKAKITSEIVENISLLYEAITKNKKLLVSLLVENGAKVNVNYCSTPLIFTAVKYSSIEVLKMLIDHGGDIFQEHNDCNAFDSAFCGTQSPNCEMVKFLLERKVNVNCKRNNYEYPPLMYAIKNQWTHFVKILLEHGVDPNFTYKDKTPLFLAVTVENVEIVKELINHGAKCKHSTKETSSNDCPIFKAISLKNESIAEMLLKQNFSENHDCIDDFNQKLLAQAIASGKLNAVKLILECGVSVNKMLEYRESQMLPLFIAIQSRNIELVKQLIELGADVNQEDNHGFTSLHIVASLPKYTSDEIVIAQITEILLENNAKIDSRNHFGETPIFTAIQHKNQKVIEILKAKGGRSDVKNNDGVTAERLEIEEKMLMRASRYNRKDYNRIESWLMNL